METMEVKESYGVGAILGTAGENINKMQDESGARINIAKRRGRSEQVDIIEIKGQPDQVRTSSPRVPLARTVRHVQYSSRRALMSDPQGEGPDRKGGGGGQAGDGRNTRGRDGLRGDRAGR
jgi:hypothetical protein